MSNYKAPKFRGFFLYLNMKFVQIFSYNEYVSAHIAKGRLEEEGITCWLKDENTVTIDPILTNAVGGIKLIVAEDQAEKATNILRTLMNEHKKLTPCPRCNSLNIELVSSPRKAANWFSALIGLLATNFALPVAMLYHCFDCGNEYKAEPPK
jgi:Putative prokaryotic signal transducing protein